MRAFLLFLAPVLGICISSASAAQDRADEADLAKPPSQAEPQADVLRPASDLPDNAAEYLPKADWRISRTRNGCSLKRDFYNGADRLTLVMDKVTSAGPFQFGIFATSFGPILPKLRTGFWPGGKMAEIDKIAVARLGSRDGFVYVDGPAPHRWNFESEPADQNEAMDRAIGKMAQTTHYIVDTSSFGIIALATGALAEPATRMSNCISERLTEWGLDFEALRNAAHRVDTKDFGNWARKVSNYYPKEARSSGFNGTIQVRLIVGPDGRVMRCHVADQLVARILREAACKRFTDYARFEPARSQDGEALADLYFTAVQYRLERQRAVGADGFLAEE
jgi:hypothetical protein